MLTVRVRVSCDCAEGRGGRALCGGVQAGRSGDGEAKEQQATQSASVMAIASCVFYGSTSVAIVFANKGVFRFGFAAPMFLLSMQVCFFWRCRSTTRLSSLSLFFAAQIPGSPQNLFAFVLRLRSYYTVLHCPLLYCIVLNYTTLNSSLFYCTKLLGACLLVSECEGAALDFLFVGCLLASLRLKGSECRFLLFQCLLSRLEV